MEKSLRKRFIFISVSAVFVVLFSIAVVINVANYWQMNTTSDEILSYIAENNGKFPNVPTPTNQDGNVNQNNSKITGETPYSTRFFTVAIDSSYQLINIDTSSIFLVDSVSAISYSEAALNSGDSTGILDSYKYLIVEKDFGQLIIFVDISEELSLVMAFILSSVLISLIAMVLVALFLIIFSKQAVAPIVESYEKQKQFITDMSHELKTPLAIIKANVEVIEIEAGETKWSEGVHKQISKLNSLINSLLSLAKLDEKPEDIFKYEFALSEVLEETVEPFGILAASKDMELTIDIDKDIKFSGDEKSIRMLTSILLENAIKYGNNEKPIEFKTYKEKKKTIIEITNSVEDVSIGKHNNWFERFQRGDESRNSETGGFGIGLSLAQSIVRKHNGKINAISRDGKSISFIIEF